MSIVLGEMAQFVDLAKDISHYSPINFHFSNPLGHPRGKVVIDVEHSGEKVVDRQLIGREVPAVELAERKQFNVTKVFGSVFRA